MKSSPKQNRPTYRMPLPRALRKGAGSDFLPGWNRPIFFNLPHIHSNTANVTIDM
jgi:hypothetical protein